MLCYVKNPGCQLNHSHSLPSQSFTRYHPYPIYYENQKRHRSTHNSVVGKTWVTKLQNEPCNDAKSTTLKMQVAKEIKLHIVHTYIVVRSLPF